jgi:hypothetical protein
MRTYRAVTTCHPEGWRLYGRRMAKLFALYWPADVHLNLYAEGFKPDNTLPSHRVFPLPEWMLKFKARHCDDPVKNGRGDARKYNLLLDAVRFSHKVGAVIDSIERALYEGDNAPDTLIWVDADTVTHSLVSHDFLRGLVDNQPVHPPEAKPAISWLNRDKKYPECGFVMFHVPHPAMPALVATWKAFYTEDRFLHLDAWTDCHTLQASVDEVNAPWSSLSGPYSSLGHPFINGPLGAVMDHLKGDRKREGKSRRHDLRARRREPYWRNVR